MATILEEILAFFDRIFAVEIDDPIMAGGHSKLITYQYSGGRRFEIVDQYGYVQTTGRTSCYLHGYDRSSGRLLARTNLYEVLRKMYPPNQVYLV